MNTRARMILFTLFAPVTVPAYVLFLAASNLLAGAFYIVIEVTLTQILGHAISLTRTKMILLAPLVVLLALPATAGQLIAWGGRLILRLCLSVGYWQLGIRRRGWTLAAGALWIMIAFWTSLTCLNAALGLRCIGGGVSQKNRDQFVNFSTRPKALGELPAEMQVRRSQLLHRLKAQHSPGNSGLEELALALADDHYRFDWLPFSIRHKLAGLPWFFTPREFSLDGLDHSELLLAALLFVWMVLIRWPGTFYVIRWGPVRIGWFLLRTIGVLAVLFIFVTWMPSTVRNTFWFPDHQPGLLFSIASPGFWMGMDYRHWVRPEWMLFNAALWMILLGLVAMIWWLAWRISPFLGWPRYYVAFMASRLLQRKRIAFFSVGAVTLCVAMMIIVISVMGGFVDSIRQRAHGLLGDLVVDGNLQGFPYYQEFIQEISNLRDEKTHLPLVEQATPLIHSYGILQFPATRKTKAVRIWGIRLDEYVRVNEFGKNLFYQNRFGGTRLDKRMSQPVYGLDTAGRVILPDDMDEHYRQYLASLPPEKRAEEEKRYQRDRGGYYPGPGVFAPSPAPDFHAGFDGKPYPGVIIGRDILFHRMPSGDYPRDERYPRGEPCYITVLPLTRTGDISPEPPPKPLFRYVDDSRTGIHEIDTMNVYVDFNTLQELLGMGPAERADGSGMASPRCSQIQIKLNPAFQQPRELLVSAKRRIWDTWSKLKAELPADAVESRMLDGMGIQTWEEMQKSYIAAIEKEKFLVLIMFGVISVVAVFLILCIFYMIVQEKTRDIGIIKSVGASTEGIAAVFLAYGAAIGIVGCLIGSLIGVNFVEHINEIQDWLARINPAWRVWSPETYSFDQIPSQWKWVEVLWISGLAILASVAGAAFPAIRAGRTWPVESLRYE